MAQPPANRSPTPADPDDAAVSPFYIVSGASAQAGAHTLKHADTFVVLDAFGDAQATGAAAEGLFHEDTRYLSRLVLLFEDQRPLLLSSRVTRDNTVLTIDLANPDVYDNGRLRLARDKLHLRRSKVLGAGACFERLEIGSFADHPVAFTLRYGFEGDFADMFEVRGQQRAARGQLFEPKVSGAEAILAYRGLDGVERRARLDFDPPPALLNHGEARYELRLPPHGAITITMALRCERDDLAAAATSDFTACVTAAGERVRRLRAAAAGIASANTAFTAWVERSEADLNMLVTDLETGPYPYAGIPWFNTAFGRDGLVTALQCLWTMPQLARGVLAFLAATQAKTLDPTRDAEPGKILHETRKSEMAVLGEVPFGRYYGSVDSTPLFVVLASAYHARTGDTDFIRAIWPNIEAALRWMHEYGDPDGDGFLEYDRRADNGLTNQGWKDSGDSIFHADGRLAQPPIALVEVQAYGYAALTGAAALAAALGEPERAQALGQEADRLRRCFDEKFWCEEIGSYALALDGAKMPCRVRSSNAGHALFAGIAAPAHAARVAATLMSPAHFSGWGIRTIAVGEQRYNPMSYHNGSIWPHDNGLIAIGFARYGLRAPLLKLFDGFYDASTFLALHRLPELFCGFERRAGESPTLYPVACSPQAWSSAVALGILGAALGVSFAPQAGQVRFTRPILPSAVDDIRLERLRLGGGAVDLLFRRHGQDAALTVLRKDSEVEIVVTS